MEVDIGNALDSVATPGISRAALERLDERVAHAHERIERGRKGGEHGYAALDLPERIDTGEIRAAAEPFEDVDNVLTIGIGGSALGAATLSAALGSEVDAYALDNVDPARTGQLLDSLDLSRTAIHVVSRSGTTVETLANFLVVRESMEEERIDWTDQTLVTTGPEGNLRKLADRHDLPVLNAPEDVPGRFSVFSSIALPVAAIQGHDLDMLLDGAASAAKTLTGSLFDCPAYAYGATCFALGRRGWVVNAMMPYAESLETFAEWFAQLWAESLGKDGLGQLPARALGATDQHSQLQLYRAGPRNVMASFVRPRNRPELSIPDTDLAGISYLSDHGLGTVLDAEFEATEASLAVAGRPSVRIEIERVDEHSLGRLLYGMEAACVLAGELYGIETFTQPAVEWGKNAARGLLGADEFEEAAAVREKNRLVID